MRILIRDLQPKTKYSLQVRSVGSDGQVSTWSRVFTFTTATDDIPPGQPENLNVSSVGDAFVATWGRPVASADGTPLNDLKHYEVEVTSTARPGKSGKFITPDNQFTLSFEQNESIFVEPAGVITFTITAVDNSGNRSASVSGTATNPPPVPITGLEAYPLMDGIQLKWEANETDTDLRGYQIWLSTSGPNGTYSRVGETPATGFTHHSTQYNTDHWFRVFSVDKFGTLSTPTQTENATRPKSPFSVDTSPPAVPTDLEATITTAGIRAELNISWTNPPNPDNDLAGTVIGYKPTDAADWSYTTIDYSTASTRIEGVELYKNYQVRARSYDWSANYSDWTNTVTTTTAAVNVEPAAVTGLTVRPGPDAVNISWDESAEDDVKGSAGVYLIDVATNNTFTSGVLSYRTGATQISVSGLSQNQTYYVRAKAVDSAGLESPWSSTVSATTTSYPATDITDGNPPASAPTGLKATGGLGYVYVEWKEIINNDPVLYEVFMSATDNFTTYNSTTKVGETGGTGIFIQNTASGAALQYGTTYYFRVRPKDQDGIGPVSGQVSSSPRQVDIADSPALAQTVKSYEREYASNSLETSAPTTGWSTTPPTRTPGAFIWERVTVTYSDSTSSTTTPVLVTGNTGEQGSPGIPGSPGAPGEPGEPGQDGRGVTAITPFFRTTTSGAAAPAKPTDATGTPSGWSATEPAYTANTELWRTERVNFSDGAFSYTDVTKVSAYSGVADAIQIANGKNRIIFSTNAASGTNYTAGDVWYRRNASGEIIAQWEFTTSWQQRMLNDAIFTSISAGKIASGSISTAELILSSSGILRSSNYASGTAGYRLSSSGLEINDGVIDAKAIKANSSFVTNLYIGTGGAIQSTGYTDAGSSGFKLSNSGLVIKGTNNIVAVEAVAAGTISAKTINIGAGGTLNIDSTGQVKSNNYAANSTGYKLSNTGLEVNDGSINAKALRTGTAIVGDLTLGQSANANGSITSFGYVPGVSGFKLDKTGLEINSGSISAAALKIQDSQNLMPPAYADFEFKDGYYQNSFWLPGRGQGNIHLEGGGLIGISDVYFSKFNEQALIIGTFNAGDKPLVWFGRNPTDYNVNVEAGEKYIVSMYMNNYASDAADWKINVKSAYGMVATFDSNNAAGQSGYTRHQGVFTVPTGVTKVLIGVSTTSTAGPKGLRVDGVQVERVIGGSEVASPWKPPSSTLIHPSSITTGMIRSSADVSVNGETFPAWSINMSGGAQFSNALIRGKMIVGVDGPRVNLYPDGDYESGDGPWETNADQYTAAIPDARSGSRVMRLNVSVGDQWTAFGPLLPTATGKRYSLTAWFRIESGGGARCLFAWTIKYSDGTEGYWSRREGERVWVPADGKWHRVTTTTTIDPPGHEATEVKFAPYVLKNSTTNPEWVQVDDFEVYDMDTWTDPDAGGSYVASGNYIPYTTGWKIDSAGEAEFNSGIFRGTVSAARFIGESFISSGSIIAGDPEVGHAELSDRGLFVFTNIPGEGVVETIRMGAGSNDLFSISDTSGNINASIDSEGKASFSSLSITDREINEYGEVERGLVIYGTEFQEWMNNTGRIVAYGGLRTDKTYTSAGDIYILNFIAEPGRTYRAGIGSTLARSSASTPRGFILNLQSPISPNSSSLGARRVIGWSYGNPPAANTFFTTPAIERILRCNVNGMSVGGELNAGMNRIIITCNAASNGSFSPYNGTDHAVPIFVEDIGPDAPSTGTFVYVDPGGGGSAPPSKTRYVSTWTSNSSECYTGSNSVRPNTNDLVQGDVGTSNGNSHGLILFTASNSTGGHSNTSLSSALSGATIEKVEVYLYANHWYYGSGGTAVLRAHTNSSLSGFTPSGTSKSFSSWGRATGKWVDITSLVTGSGGPGTGLRSVTIGKSPSVGNYTYYGRFNAHNQSNPPKLRVTYVK